MFYGSKLYLGCILCWLHEYFALEKEIQIAEHLRIQFGIGSWYEKQGGIRVGPIPTITNINYNLKIQIYILCSVQIRVKVKDRRVSLLL